MFTKPMLGVSRCAQCSIKLKLTDVSCKCCQKFCMAHRLPEAHNCSFNFKKEGHTLLEKQNPKTAGTKIEHI